MPDRPADASRGRRRRIAVVALTLALTGGLAAPRWAVASTWDVSLPGASGESPADAKPFAFPLHATLTDPTGTATDSIGGVPVLISRDPTNFSVTVSSSFTDAEGCARTISASASGPIVTTAGGSTAAGPISGVDVKTCPDRMRTRSITGTLTALSADLILPAPPTVGAVSGPVTVRTATGAGLLTAGSSVSPGTVIDTGGTGSASLTFSGGTTLSLAAGSLVAILPATLPTGDDVVLSHVRGRLTHAVAGSPPVADHYRVLTATATMRPTGTQFTTEYTQPATIGSTVVSVQSGVVEVTSRRGQLTTLTAGTQASFDDTVARVIPILQVDRGTIPGGVVDTFSWTVFTGAAGYLFEYTLNPAGFTSANPTAAEHSSSTLLLPSTAFSQANGIVDYPVRVPAGILSPTAPGWWRVFAVDASGAILPGSTASDASRVFVQ